MHTSTTTSTVFDCPALPNEQANVQSALAVIGIPSICILVFSESLSSFSDLQLRALSGNLLHPYIKVLLKNLGLVDTISFPCGLHRVEYFA